MKKNWFLFTLILLLPIMFLVIVNESHRFKVTEKGYERKGVKAINSNVKTPEKCSWYCHSDTGYCKKHHTFFLKKYSSKIDPLYFGIINYLHDVGDYGLANIIFLVVLIPLIIYLLLVKLVVLSQEIKKIRNA